MLAVKWLFAEAAGTEAEARRAERKFGYEAAQEFAREFDRSVPEFKQRTATRLGASLAKTVKTPCPVSYRVVAAPVTNAYAFPGGFVYVSERLFDAFRDDEDAIAFIFAHETAHVVLGHAREAAKKKLLLGLMTFKAGGLGAVMRTLIVKGTHGMLN